MKPQVTDFKNISDELLDIPGLPVLSIILHKSRILSPRMDDDGALLLIVEDGFDQGTFITELRKRNKLNRFLMHFPPLIFTNIELENGGDIFPLEFHEVQSHQDVLFGHGIEHYIQLTDQNLRLEVEANLRRQTVLLRREYFVSGTQLGSLLRESFTNFITNAKYILYLIQNKMSDLSDRDIILLLADHINFSVEPFYALMRLMDTRQRFSKGELQKLFFDYLNQLKLITRHVDSLELSNNKPATKRSLKK